MLRHLSSPVCRVCVHTHRHTGAAATAVATMLSSRPLRLAYRTQSSPAVQTAATEAAVVSSPDSSSMPTPRQHGTNGPVEQSAERAHARGKEHVKTSASSWRTWYQRRPRWCRFQPPRSRAEWCGVLLGGSIFPLSVMAVILYDRQCPQPWRTDDTHTDVSSGDVAPDLRSMQSVAMVPRTHLGGPFRLRESKTGDYITDSQLFSNHWTLLYFGFAKCAEICPSTLSFITEVLHKCDAVYGAGSDGSGAGPSHDDEERSRAEAARLQAAFLSIDFIRDTPAVVQRFLSRYDPRVRGLCGTRREVEAAARVWRVYYSSVDETEEEEAARIAAGEASPSALDDTFQFDHSTAIYLVGPDGKMKDFFFKEMGVDDMVDRLGIHFSNVYGFSDTRADAQETSS